MLSNMALAAISAPTKTRDSDAIFFTDTIANDVPTSSTQQGYESLFVKDIKIRYRLFRRLALRQSQKIGR